MPGLSKVKKIFIGFDSHQVDAYAVACHTIERHCLYDVKLYPLILDELRDRGLYWRVHWTDPAGIVRDVISNAPMSTEFANTRFLMQALAGRGWVMFVDGDVLARRDLTPLLCDVPDDKFAVMCVQHNYAPTAESKMGGQIQSAYPRKNWSSMMLWNCDHPANRRLTVEMVNSQPGRDLHRFCWLDDAEIGAVDIRYNWLVGHSRPEDGDPAIVHFTEGVPRMPGHENDAYADEWREALHNWARGRDEMDI